MLSEKTKHLAQERDIQFDSFYHCAAITSFLRISFMTNSTYDSSLRKCLTSVHVFRTQHDEQQDRSKRRTFGEAICSIELRQIDDDDKRDIEPIKVLLLTMIGTRPFSLSGNLPS